MTPRRSTGPRRARPSRRLPTLLASLAILVGLLAAVAGTATSALPARAAEPTVDAVLFYSPTCPHCHQVIAEDLPPIQARFGGQLRVLFVDVSTELGAALYQGAVTQFAVPDDRLGVPTLVVGDVVLVGALEIPEQLPALTERLLAEGGAAWPAIPGLVDALPTPPPVEPATGAAASTGPETAPASPAIDVPPPGVAGSPVALASMLERVGWDPLGNALAIVVLVGLLLSLVWSAVAVARHGVGRTGHRPSHWIAGLALIGLVVAGYLASVELAGAAAVCGPVGNCHVVHASEFAHLFGIPVGLLGAATYACILGCWLVARRADGRPARLAWSGLVGLALGGTLFSVYLTFLEPFVIGATCAWCLASAVLMGAILVAAVSVEPPARVMSSPRR